MTYKSYKSITKKHLVKIIKKHFPNQRLIDLFEITESFVNPVYSFTLGNNEQYILKFNNPRWPYKQQREIESIIKVQTETKVPVPNIFVHSSLKDQFTYMILEKMPGIDLRHAIYEKILTSNEILEIIKKIGSYIGDIHKITFDFYGDFSSVYKLVESSKNHLWGNRFENWPMCFKAFCLDILNWVDTKSFQQYRKKIRDKINEYVKIIPESDFACFVHSDIQPSNIIIRNNSISALIDFEWSFAGSASFDFYMTQAGFYFSLFPTLSGSSMYDTYSDITLEKIKHSFLNGYRINNNTSLKEMPSELVEFIWLLYMIGSWDWIKQTSSKLELKRFENDIHQYISKFID